MSDVRLDLRQVRRAFARSVSRYEQHDALQREVEGRLFESLDYCEGEPARVLDVGCGTGRGTAALKKRWRNACVIALDVSLPMLQHARRHLTWWKPFTRVVADALVLPFADRSMDVVYSNLCMQWCGPPRPFLTELCRVLKPGGLLVASSLGPDTLCELREAWDEADAGQPHVAEFSDMHDIGDAALASGLKDPVLDADHVVLEYPQVHGLLRDLKGLGATNADRERPRGLTGKVRFQTMVDVYEKRRRNGKIPATWEVVTMHAWGLPVGAMPLYGGRETRFEVIKRREPPAPRK
ncbi:MAG: malonyl-ACP O-methyltransferase BioC [Rhodanobacteraceae bacterium]